MLSATLTQPASGCAKSLCGLYLDAPASLSNFYRRPLIYVGDRRTDDDDGNGFGKETEMLDAVMLVAGVAFFAIAIAYVAACDRM